MAGRGSQECSDLPVATHPSNHRTGISTQVSGPSVLALPRDPDENPSFPGAMCAVS